MNDDLDEEIVDTDDGFDEFAQKSGLGESIRRSPVAKVGIVIGILVTIGVVMVMFGGEKKDDAISIVPDGSSVTSVPGSNEKIAPAYIAAVEQQNEADLDKAIAEGGSAIPVPIDNPDTRLDVPEIEEQAEDPLHRWRMLQEERTERQMKLRDSDQAPVTVLDAEQQSEAINNLAEIMIQQMESILARNTAETLFTSKTLITYKEVEEGGVNGSGGQGSDSSADSGFEEVEEVEVIIAAGTIVYGQMLLEANSDVPFTVMAKMVSGPLKGWNLLGKFSVLDDIELLAITFNTAVNKDGKQYDVNALMLNPDTGLAGMRTDIDHRYLKRIILPAAAEFISGYASAIAKTGKTSVVVSGETVTTDEAELTDDEEVATGVESAAEEISEIIDDMADVEVKIVIDAGTPIGIFFAKNVEEHEEGI